MTRRNMAKKPVFKKRKIRLKNSKDSGLNFSAKAVAAESVISILCGVISLIAFLALSADSAYYEGKTAVTTGIYGMIFFAVSITGFVLALGTFKRDDVAMKLSIIGAAVNAVAVIIYLILYAYGLVIGMM